MTSNNSNNNMNVSADRLISVTLEAQHWNIIMAALNDLPYKIAKPVIEEVLTQVRNSLSAPNLTPAESGEKTRAECAGPS